MADSGNPPRWVQRTLQDGSAPAAPRPMIRELEGLTNLVVKQSRRGWLQECFGCEAKTVFRVAKSDAPRDFLFYVEEESNCCLRLCCAPIRPWTSTMSVGDKAGGEALVEYRRPLRCAPGALKCCCFQEVSVTDVRSGAPLGLVKERPYCCVPTLAVYDPTAERMLYKVRQPTVCFGCCVNACDSRGGGCCKVPFYLYPPGENEPAGHVVKAWGGWRTEVLTDADTFELEAPQGASSADVAVLVGATLLINELYFEFYTAGEGDEGGTSML